MRSEDVPAAVFDALVDDEADALPDDLVAGLDNVAIVVEDASDAEPGLLGLYEGVALTERGDYGFGELPDRIVLYRASLVAIADDLDHLREQIRITLVHEIAHFHGIDDDRLHELGWG